MMKIVHALTIMFLYALYKINFKSITFQAYFIIRFLFYHEPLWNIFFAENVQISRERQKLFYYLQLRLAIFSRSIHEN